MKRKKVVSIGKISCLKCKGEFSKSHIYRHIRSCDGTRHKTKICEKCLHKLPLRGFNVHVKGCGKIRKIRNPESKMKPGETFGEMMQRNIREGRQKIHKGVRTVYGTATNRYKSPNVDSILELSTRTIRKILKRLNISCSRCQWKDGTCDIHHINGRKINDPDNHKNLCYICPNCHRLVHEKKIKKDELISLQQQVGDVWRKFYFG